MSTPTPPTARPRSPRPTSPPGSTRSRPPSARGRDLVPRVGIVLGSGLGSLADERRGSGRRSRSTSCRAGPPPPHRAMPGGCSSGAWPASRWPRSRAASTSTRATTRACRPAGPAVPAPGRRVVILTNAAGGVNPAYGAGHADGHQRPPQPDRPDAAARPQRGRARRPLPGHDRRLGAAPPGTPPRRRQAEGVELEEGVYAGLIGPPYETPGGGPDAEDARRPTPSGCRRWSRRSRRAGSGSRCAASAS